MPCFDGSFPGALGSCRPGHSFDRTSVRLLSDTRPNSRSMSSVVWRNLVDARATFGVTDAIHGPLGEIFNHRRAAPGAPVERVPRVAFERRRQPRPDEATAGHGAFSVSASQGVRGLHSAPSAWIRRIE